MDHHFTAFINDHLEELLCQAEKEQSLAILRKPNQHPARPLPRRPSRHPAHPDPSLQDCAVSPSFSHSHL